MRTELQRLFGPHLRALRERKGLTQEGLAAGAGLHVTHISLLEGGKRSARIETLERLARALRVQPSELLPRIALDTEQGLLSRPHQSRRRGPAGK